MFLCVAHRHDGNWPESCSASIAEHMVGLVGSDNAVGMGGSVMLAGVRETLLDSEISPWQ